MKSIRKITNLISLLVILLFVTLALIATRVKSKLFMHELPRKEIRTDSIIIHFTHGSIISDTCFYKKERLGGYLGGHVEIQIDDKVYGFLADSLPIHIKPNKKFNSKFEKINFTDWLRISNGDKITSITFPITKKQHKSIGSILKKYNKKTPCDYAFLGQRCASLTASILSKSKILNKFSESESIIAFFYPRTLRYTLIDYAFENDLTIKTRNGFDCMSWE